MMIAKIVKTIGISLCIGLIIGIIACGAEAPVEVNVTVDDQVAEPTWNSVAEDALSESQRAQLTLGREAQSELVKGLMAALMQAMDDGGPESAINVCNDEALKITNEVASNSGVWLGRTSQKLRNPANMAPDWTREIISGPTAEPKIQVASDGRLGVLTPIFSKAECGMCHGPVENIDEGLYASILELYPEDKAIGFYEGDLRGWFWFEVPAASS